MLDTQTEQKLTCLFNQRSHKQRLRQRRFSIMGFQVNMVLTGVLFILTVLWQVPPPTLRLARTHEQARWLDSSGITHFTVKQQNQSVLLFFLFDNSYCFNSRYLYLLPFFKRDTFVITIINSFTWKESWRNTGGE